jgi:predicted transcriptional regulator
MLLLQAEKEINMNQKQNFIVVPDYQILAEKQMIDETGEYIVKQKSKQYKYKIKVIKRKLKMLDVDGLEKFQEISMKSGKAVLPIMNLIIKNTDRENMLVDNRTMVTSAYLTDKYNVSRSTVNKYIKKLIDAELIKRHGKNFMLSPFIFYPYVSDMNLKILQEYWTHDFKKSKEIIESELQVEVSIMLEEAKDFIGASAKEFEMLKQVKNIT